MPRRGTASLILQTPRHFLMVDTINGLQVLNYDGRVVSQPKFQAMRPDALSTLNVGYAPDLIAVCLLYTSPSPRDRG